MFAYLRAPPHRRAIARQALRALLQAKRDLRRDAVAVIAEGRADGRLGADGPATRAEPELLGTKPKAKPTRQNANIPVAVRDIAWAVRGVARRLPRTECLPQAIAAMRMLRLAGFEPRFHVGVRKGPEVEGHAWVTLSDVVVVGGAGSPAGYQELR